MLRGVRTAEHKEAVPARADVAVIVDIRFLPEDPGGDAGLLEVGRQRVLLARALPELAYRAPARLGCGDRASVVRIAPGEVADPRGAADRRGHKVVVQGRAALCKQRHRGVHRSQRAKFHILVVGDEEQLEKETDRDRQRQRNRQRKTETDRQRERDRERERQTEKDRQRKID
eukprot:COSAG03_NODE_3375_length_2051_cov_2178.030225_3_plen_172_part_01